jgi:hypothetical protein
MNATAIEPGKEVTVDDVTLNKYDKNSESHLFSVPFKITQEDAERLQIELGYHPAGYGFYQFIAGPNGSSWSCSTSCD